MMVMMALGISLDPLAELQMGRKMAAKKFARGFPLTPGVKFEEGLEAKDRWAATSVAAKDGSGSDGGFAESESPVVLASMVSATFSTVTSVDGASSEIDRGVSPAYSCMIC